MATSDFLRRKKTKTKEYSDDGKMVTKTKTMSTPKEDGGTKNVTKTTTRPTFIEGAKRLMDFQPIGKTTKTNVSYSQANSSSPEQKLRESRAARSANQTQMNKAKQSSGTTGQLKNISRPDTPLANTPEPKKYQ